MFDFLSTTGLPLVSSLASSVRLTASLLAVVGGAYGVFALLWLPDGWWNAELPWSGALPSLAATPFYVLAWSCARQERIQAAGKALFTALFLLSMLATWPRGAFCPAWYMQPFLALMATCSLGVVPGLSATLLVVAAMLAAGFAAPQDALSSVLAPDLWTHTLSLAAVTLASALAGAMLHKLLLAALLAAEAQRLANYDSRRALRYRERLLRHAMRVETVGDLAGMVSHQLRNTFQILGGHVAFGISGDDGERNQRLLAIGRTLEDSRPLLDQLMTLAHTDEGRAEPVDLGEVVEQFCAQAHLVMPSSIALEHRRSPQSLPAFLNPRGLEHALWNLVINARQAMPHGGRIVVATAADGGCARVEVSDSGTGIPPEIQSRIFDPYFTTKPPGQGTGLGLAAVTRFMRASSGAIQLESSSEQGTRFSLAFPLRQEQTERQSA